ncbi:MAG: sulfate adenylyltransferase subunit 1 [Acidimicrobiia bacterium]
MSSAEDISRAGLVRVATAGSVDDGKSTLIGRLLYDSKSILEDQLAAVEHDSRRRGLDEVNLALLTDGLRAEREQGITIDVAYRYFATPKRTFVLADTPGHVQYTRNMVTGASTADVAVVLVDARKGVLEQSRRHASIAALLRIPHVVLAINKMDLVDWDESVFDSIALDCAEVAALLGITDYVAVPLSALRGDNVVERSASMPWYDGPALLEYLEGLEVASSHDYEHLRLPVQYVILAGDGGHHDQRRYAGQLAGGVVRPGDDVLVLPGGLRTTVTAVHEHDTWLDEAFAPQSVGVTLADQLDVGRGDMLVGADPAGMPVVTRELRATVCWMSEQPLAAGRRYALKHTSRTARVAVTEVHDRLDLDALEHRPADSLAMNEIGEVSLRTSVPLVIDPFSRNRVTGRFILVDESTNATAGAGLILG